MNRTRIDGGRIELTPLPAAAAASQLNDRPTASRLIGARLPDAWPHADLLDVLPMQAAAVLAAWVCIDGCSPSISAGKLASGITGYGESIFMGIAGPIEVAAVLALIGYVLARRRRRTLAAAFGLGGFVALNFWTVTPVLLRTSPGGLPAALALVVGSVIWVIPFWPERGAAAASGA